jgi:hypothetical protein
MHNSYETTELEVAAFLKARGHKLLGAHPRGRLVEFTFDGAATEDVNNYIAGTELPARDLFESHRSLRALIQQVKQHNHNGTEQSWNRYTQ